MEPVSSPNGISFTPDHDIDNMPEISTLVIPGATGALEGRTSTTYWRAADELRGVGVTVEGARYVQDGKFWSGGGVTSGIDQALAFIQSEAGREMAGIIQLTL